MTPFVITIECPCATYWHVFTEHQDALDFVYAEACLQGGFGPDAIRSAHLFYTREEWESYEPGIGPEWDRLMATLDTTEESPQ